MTCNTTRLRILGVCLAALNIRTYILTLGPGLKPVDHENDTYIWSSSRNYHQIGAESPVMPRSNVTVMTRSAGGYLLLGFTYTGQDR